MRISWRDRNRRRGADLERLVHRHLFAVDQFLTLIFPLADSDTITDVVFTEFATGSRRPIAEDEQWELFGCARKAVLRSYPDPEWLDQNAHRIRASLSMTLMSDADSYRQDQVRCIVSATEALTSQQQFVLRLAMIYDTMTARQLSLVLGVTPGHASRAQSDALAAYRDAYFRCDPDHFVDGASS